MIEYHGDGLVPSELCRLLYQAVPRRDHVPVRFFNRHDAFGNPTGGRRRGYSTDFGIFMRGRRPWVGINLNAVFFSATPYLYPRLASSTAVWRALLHVCLHELGHAATRGFTERPNRHEYNAKPWGDVYRHTELLAEEWKDRMIERILRRDARLGQPRRITGYLGVRLADKRIHLGQWIRESGNARITGNLRATYVKEQRCWKSGAQLTAGDVLHELGLDPHNFTNAHRVLRRASEEMGVDYTDGAGKRHKLYAWGDVPVLRGRMEERLEELVFRHEPSHTIEYDTSGASDEVRAVSDDGGRGRSGPPTAGDDSCIPF